MLSTVLDSNNSEFTNINNGAGIWQMSRFVIRIYGCVEIEV